MSPPSKPYPYACTPLSSSPNTPSPQRQEDRQTEVPIREEGAQIEAPGNRRGREEQVRGYLEAFQARSSRPQGPWKGLSRRLRGPA